MALSCQVTRKLERTTSIEFITISAIIFYKVLPLGITFNS
jgi:hypothetical protein